jgi:hypothetical protein
MDNESTTFSVDLNQLNTAQLVQILQGLGHQIDKLREQREYIRAKIDKRLAAGIEDDPAAGAVFAPGAVIEVSARQG